MSDAWHHSMVPYGLVGPPKCDGCCGEFECLNKYAAQKGPLTMYLCEGCGNDLRDAILQTLCVTPRVKSP